MSKQKIFSITENHNPKACALCNFEEEIGWLSLKSSLPEEGKLVLCKLDDEDPFVGYWQSTRQCMLATVANGAGECGEGIVNEDYLPCEATHWKEVENGK